MLNFFWIMYKWFQVHPVLCFTVLPSERPLHYQERVLSILHSFGTDSHLLIKKHLAMDAMVVYLGKRTNPTKWFSLDHCIVCPPRHLFLNNLSFCLPASKVDASKHGMMKFREERSILGLGLSTGSFHDRYFILNSNSLRMYKEVRVRLIYFLFLSFCCRILSPAHSLCFCPSLSVRVTVQNVIGQWKTWRCTWVLRRSSVRPHGEHMPCSTDVTSCPRQN